MKQMADVVAEEAALAASSPSGRDSMRLVMEEPTSAQAAEEENQLRITTWTMAEPPRRKSSHLLVLKDI
ncbi:hypothetical protein NL676_026174 [Syzygium grande]|nr:hypothetical protein NL676_026174 [Syzygium grande]